MLARQLAFAISDDQRDVHPALRELGAWPDEERLDGVDLNLGGRSRVSALPWRGQFSPQTAERLLRALVPTAAGSLVDPFVGSGTSLIEAARCGLEADGLDVNPAAVAFAGSARWAALTIEERRKRLEVLAAWCEQIAGVGEHGVVTRLAAEPEISDRHALAILAAAEGGLTHRGFALAFGRFKFLIDTLPRQPLRIDVRLGDARATGLPAASFDVALTSPPYINVFNYHQYGRPLTDLFGWHVLEAARAEVGSNRQNRQNRFRTVVQYCLDMAIALDELRRVLKPEGVAILVVGRESMVRGVPFFNGEILARLVVALQLFAIRTRAERVFVSRYGQRIYEDILILRSPQYVAATHDELVATARSVGREVLAEAESTSADVQRGIEEALASIILPSPLRP